MKSKSPPHPNKNLKSLHEALSQDLMRFEASLPRGAEGLTEEFERYARIISLLIRSADLLMKREDQYQQSSSEGEIPKDQLIDELERAFNRIFAQEEAKKIHKESDS